MGRRADLHGNSRCHPCRHYDHNPRHRRHRAEWTVCRGREAQLRAADRPSLYRSRNRQRIGRSYRQVRAGRKHRSKSIWTHAVRRDDQSRAVHVSRTPNGYLPQLQSTWIHRHNPDRRQRRKPSRDETSCGYLEQPLVGRTRPGSRRIDQQIGGMVFMMTSTTRLRSPFRIRDSFGWNSASRLDFSRCMVSTWRRSAELSRSVGSSPSTERGSLPRLFKPRSGVYVAADTCPRRCRLTLLTSFLSRGRVLLAEPLLSSQFGGADFARQDVGGTSLDCPPEGGSHTLLRARRLRCSRPTCRL